MATTDDRVRLLRRLEQAYPFHYINRDEFDGLLEYVRRARPDQARYVLIERQTLPGYDAEHYLSSHDTIEEALDYSANQDHAADWEPVALVDLDSLLAWDVERRYVARTVSSGAVDDLLEQREQA